MDADQKKIGTLLQVEKGKMYRSEIVLKDENGRYFKGDGQGIKIKPGRYYYYFYEGGLREVKVIDIKK